MNKRWLGKLGIVSILIFFYTPMLILMIFSFNAKNSNNVFNGFTLQWYQKMFNNQELIRAVYYTIFTAIIATFVSIVLGTLTAIGLSKSRPIIKQYLTNINDLPILNPEIVTAISLMLLFLSLNLERGLLTMVVAHIAFCTPYVIISVYPKVRALDPNLAEAAMDLGATPRQALMKVIIPQLMPGIIAGALIAFTMSFDDFVISYFVSGNGIQNISIYVFNASKRIDLTVNALFTIMVLVIATIMITANLVIPAVVKRNAKRKVISEKQRKRKFFMNIALALMVAVITIVSIINVTIKDSRPVLRIYNWGEYIDKTVIHQFEQEFGIRVIYETFDSNESMYTKLRSGSQYDVIIPSDYMVERLINEQLVQPIDWTLIPNKEELIEDAFNFSFDPGLEYSAPYFYGTVGLLYNEEKVSEEDLNDGWGILNNPVYRNRIFMYNSVRDGFMIPLKYLGYSLNSEDPSEVNEAFNWLLEQKRSINPVYLIDTIIDQMKAAEKDIAIVYSGDANEIIAENDSMKYYLPDQGTNYWVDSMVITENSKNVEAAHQFINFMLDPEIAYLNTVAVGYTTPIQTAQEEAAAGEFEGIASYVVPPMREEDEIFHDLSAEAKRMYEDYWTKLLAE